MPRLVRILLIEDNPGDVDLTRECLGTGTTQLELSVVPDGVQAMEYLKLAVAQERPRPDLILLDLNLPRKGGLEVLGEVRDTPSLRSIPIVVLSSSDAPKDIDRSYQLGANGYVTKPPDLNLFRKILRCIESYWCGVSKLPSGSAHGSCR